VNFKPLPYILLRHVCCLVLVGDGFGAAGTLSLVYSLYMIGGCAYCYDVISNLDWNVLGQRDIQDMKRIDNYRDPAVHR
jgi:hypothetical protein